jgi:hypothetical protein
MGLAAELAANVLTFVPFLGFSPAHFPQCQQNGFATDLTWLANAWNLT